jgi:DNA-directed RNA polymerase specialized sigma24 family protein
MDNVLLPYLTANDEGQRQQYLHELLTLRAGPLVRGVLLRKLGFYVSAQGVNENNEDAEDLYQNVLTRVVEGLNQLQSPAAVDIQNFELYVSRLAANSCTDFCAQNRRRVHALNTVFGIYSSVIEIWRSGATAVKHSAALQCGKTRERTRFRISLRRTLRHS